ncbi:MAG: DUF5689 domain-containing protein [Paludibacteraceae bacterium]|nr:DUF5689 domain-containing protein [Paludibacteraceae bacterium]
MKRLSIFSLVVVAGITAISTLLSSCKVKEPVMEDMFYAADDATIAELTADGRLFTLQEFKDSFMTEEGNYLSDSALYRTRSTGSAIPGKYLFSLDTLPTNGRGIYIMGRVATDDYGGNFYKTLVIQQIVDGEQQALRISVDAGSVSGLYPRGQMILIRCNGMAIGRYANQPQLCVPSYNNNVFADKAIQKVGWAPGRIPLPRFKAATKYIGTPDEKALQYDKRTIADITALYDLATARKEDGKLVYIEDIHYSGQCLTQDKKSLMYCTTGNPADDGNANVFAPTTGNVGYPQSRVIFDEEDEHFICVSMSEYAKEANFYLPGATAAEEGEVFFYDSAAVVDLSQPYLLADLKNDGHSVVVPVDGRKAYQGWRMDDVVYTDSQKAQGFVCIGKDATGKDMWSKALGVVHCSEYVGSVHGVLSYYMDNASYAPAATNWAISICDLSDLHLEKNGVAWTPLEYTPN